MQAEKQKDMGHTRWSYVPHSPEHLGTTETTGVKIISTIRTNIEMFNITLPRG